MLALFTPDRSRFGQAGPHMATERTTVFTDGACLGNPGKGGWAWAVPDGPFASGPEVMTTNQRMEIRAALEAARALPGPLDIVSDSTYVVHCFRDRWWEGWLRNGWKNKARKPVANQDLWEPLVDLYRADRGRLCFRWVKGHSNDPMNDLVDRLAVDAARRQEGRSGVGVPGDLGPPDAPGGRAAGVGVGGGAGGAGAPGVGGAPVADERVPAGHLVVVAGHRPPALGGYDENLLAGGLRAKLAEVLSAKRALHPDLKVLTGLGLGAEQLGAEAARQAGVPYVVVLPFPGQEAVWPAASKARYTELLQGADDHVLLQAKSPESKQKAGAALSRRDAWLARHANEAVVVWDGDDDRVGRLVRSLQDHLGEEEVWVLHP
ncbi:MAG: ribonuclease [Acidimicrobiaceae bacterium]|nr:ribonuclease [Acidimicrobiaceae bacterium]